MLITLHEKPYFLFPDVLKRWSFQRNCAGIWSFLYYLERWHFFFPKIWYCTLDGKRKMIFLKNYTIIRYFLQTFWEDGLSKKGHDLSCISRKMVFFSPKTWYFFLVQKLKDSLSQEIHGNMMHCPPGKKNRKPNI